MKKIIKLKNWKLRQATKSWKNDLNKKDGWYTSKEAFSVHEILKANGVLGDELEQGECESSKWVAENDWVYQTSFAKPNVGAKEEVVLDFAGIDTYADIYLNGTLIEKAENFFLPVQIDVTKKLKKENQLVVYFHSPFKIIQLKKKKSNPDWLTHFQEYKLLRKPTQDFHNFAGARPYLVPIGFYKDVALVVSKGAKLTYFDVDTSMAFHCDRATFLLNSEVTELEKGNYVVEYAIYNPSGKCVVKEKVKVTKGSAPFEYRLENPKLWWPRPYGKQPRYKVVATLKQGNTVLEQCEKKVGLRKIEKIGDMLFAVNGREVRLWGANLTPVEALSHRYNEAKGEKILELTKDANMNIVRIWGEQAPPGDAFYEYLDENGIMLWQDFYVNTCGLFPDSDEYRAEYLREVEHMVKELKHHPCILLWCGNNESLMISNCEVADGRTYGAIPLTEDFPRLLGKLDPSRFYTPSSPHGAYKQPQDPMRGDMHGYLGVQYEPGVKFPVFYSESCHMCMPPLRSLKKFMKPEDLWPENYSGAFGYPDNFDEVKQQYKDYRYGPDRSRAWCYSYWRTLPLPETWKRYVSRFAICENWDIEKYYDGVDLESAMYKFTAPSVDYLKHSVERVRRGSLASEVQVPRRCAGYMFWKLNDTWPYINFTLIDYYLEPVASYYQIKRSYAPVIVSIDCEEDHLNLWGVNDGDQDFVGEIHFKVFSKIRNVVLNDLVIPVVIYAGKSQVVMNLDHLGAISRECVLYADLRDKEGNIVHRTDDFLDLERNQVFPKAKLTMRQEGNELVIKTDQFARFVELVGEEDGDEFGWDFEDNYFNLFPFEEKRIKLSGKHKKGTITAKAHYSPYSTTCKITRK